MKTYHFRNFFIVIFFSVVSSYSSIDSTVAITEYRVDLWEKFYKPELSKDTLTRAHRTTYSYYDNGLVSQIKRKSVLISLTLDESGFIKSVKESDFPDPKWSIYEHKFGEKGEDLSVVSFTSGGFDSSIYEVTWYADDSIKYTTYSKKDKDEPFVKSIIFYKYFGLRKSRGWGFWLMKMDSTYSYDSNSTLKDRWVYKYDSVGNEIVRQTFDSSGNIKYERFTTYVYDSQNRVTKKIDSTLYLDGIKNRLFHDTTFYQYDSTEFVRIERGGYGTEHFFYIYKNTASIRRKMKRPLIQNGLYLLLNKYNINGTRRLSPSSTVGPPS